MKIEFKTKIPEQFSLTPLELAMTFGDRFKSLQDEAKRNICIKRLTERIEVSLNYMASYLALTNLNDARSKNIDAKIENIRCKIRLNEPVDAILLCDLAIAIMGRNHPWVNVGSRIECVECDISDLDKNTLLGAALVSDINTLLWANQIAENLNKTGESES